MSAWLQHAWDLAKGAAAFVGGVLVPAGTIYVQAGGPLPATTAYVREEVRAVLRRVDGLHVEILELQRDAIVAARARLRLERRADGSLLDGLTDPAARATLDRRLGEIEDELRDLERRDEEVRKRIETLR